MRKYEGLFILNSAAQEMGIAEAIEKVSAEIVAEGGRIDNVQKMDKRNFARVANKKNQSGYYVNITFEVPGESIQKLNKAYEDIRAQVGQVIVGQDQVIDHLLAGLQRNYFYIICPDNDTPPELDARRIQWSADDLIQNRPALSRWHPDFSGAYAAFVADPD